MFTPLERGVCLGAQFCARAPSSLLAVHWRERSAANLIGSILRHAIMSHADSSVVVSGMLRRVWHTTTKNFGSLFTHHAHRTRRAEVYMPSASLHFNDMLLSSLGFPSK